MEKDLHLKDPGELLPFREGNTDLDTSCLTQEKAVSFGFNYTGLQSVLNAFPFLSPLPTLKFYLVNLFGAGTQLLLMLLMCHISRECHNWVSSEQLGRMNCRLGREDTQPGGLVLPVGDPGLQTGTSPREPCLKSEVSWCPPSSGLHYKYCKSKTSHSIYK